MQEEGSKLKREMGDVEEVFGNFQSTLNQLFNVFIKLPYVQTTDNKNPNYGYSLSRGRPSYYYSFASAPVVTPQ